ncbi:hypothetical protein O1611_g1692 [Lasiodiplodia mahajangana]|uniref:Uncharacterized protein n=1 Tax=Lasiodiplodia mahajangana TaxID=1108764 RepID=A0ACC2JXA0_9PEZI|nr:hypothetical protein O1611_g1692 [Lasiodiplodia mahajangana]
MDPWQQLYRGDESIYCAAPLPSSPDDIIYLGSDDGIDDTTRIAKRQRYEKHGRRYLQGRPLHILSASLRGPFSKDSGWQNPWLPKLSPHHAKCLDSLSQPPLISSAAQSESNAPVNKPSSDESSTMQDLSDSMECHLPSPQSHENLQFSDSPSHTERRTRIESWADNVHEHIPEKDDFWAPNRAVVNRHVQCTAKRSAGRDWLKRRPAKRRKPDASQVTEASYTPTPIPPARPRATRKESLTQRSTNRSFEMTTPSSSPEQGPKESLALTSHTQVMNEEGGQPIPSNISAEDSRTPIEPPIPTRKEEGWLDMEDEEIENIEQSKDRYQDRSPRDTSSNGEEAENTIGFQDCVDESFFYRTRQLKQSTPPAAPSATVIDCPSQRTQTKEPLARIYDDSVMVSSNQGARKSSSQTICNHSIPGDTELVERPNESSVTIATNDESNHSIITAMVSDHKATALRYSTADTNADTNSRSRVDRSRSLNDITSDPRLNICGAIPQTIPKVKVAQRADPESLLDDGPTLIGDPMDPEKQGDTETVPQNSSIRSGHALLLQHYAVSATIMANASQQPQCCDAATPNTLYNVKSCPIATVPQERSMEPQSTITKRIDQGSQSDLTSSVTSSNNTTGQAYEGRPQMMAGNQTIPASQQSPWAPYVVNDSVQCGNDNIKRAEQTLENESAKPDIILCYSLALIQCSPTTRPSQQSPWAHEVVESVNRVRLGETPSMDLAVTMDTELSRKSQRLTLAINQESLSITSHVSSCERQSPESDMETKEGAISPIQEFPYTPVPHAPRQPTPDGGVSIRSFSNFNFSSPQRSVCPPASSTSRSILSIRKQSSRRTTEKSSRRVSFATLPHEQENSSSLPSTRARAASPPLPILVDIEEETVNGRYRKHFDVMNRRFTANEVPSLQYYRRLLPSCSQQKPDSPSIEAMAEAFREADAHPSDDGGNVVEDIKPDEEKAEGPVVEIEDRPQSPWQQDSEGTDDVAAVIGNLPEFLDVWDVDMEMDRNRAELNEVGSHGVPSNTDIGILHGVGIW